ncbi:adenosine receptor A1-like [Tachypleus tridentatus]|uniref:adenosine receptor A1-like n=1 Tax=Tachypleus tridentatus TaxID=6853 RepID=UPI003FD6BC4A
MAVNELPIAYTIVEVIVAVMAVSGNTLVLIAFMKEKRLRKLTNFYILSLSTADFLVGLIGVPSAIMTKLGLPENSFKGCLFMLSLLVVLCTISILNLVAVSLDRYWAILHPFSYHQRITEKSVAVIIMTCWVLGIIVGFLPFFGWNSGPVASGKCYFVKVMDYNFLVFLYFATIVYPSVLMALFYGRIYHVVLKQLRQISVLELTSISSINTVTTSFNGEIINPIQDPDQPQMVQKTTPKSVLVRQANRKDVRKAKKLAIIVVFFIMCWIPLYTVNCVQAFCRDCGPPLWVLDVFIILSHANSSLNPLLYAYHMKEFRDFVKRWRCRCLKKAQSVTLDRDVAIVKEQVFGKSLMAGKLVLRRNTNDLGISQLSRPNTTRTTQLNLLSLYANVR